MDNLTTGVMTALSRVCRTLATEDRGAPCLRLGLSGGLLFLLCAVIPAGFAQDHTTTAPLVSRLLAVQILLDRAGFSVGEIDGRDGLNTRKAVHALQAAKRLPPTSKVE